MRLHSGQSLRVLISKMLLSFIPASWKTKPHRAEVPVLTLRTGEGSVSECAFSAIQSYLSPRPSVQGKVVKHGR